MIALIKIKIKTIANNIIKFIVKNNKEIDIISGMLLFAFLNHLIMNNISYLIDLLHKDILSVVVQLVVAVNAAVLVYYTLIPKVDTKALEQSLLKLNSINYCYLEHTKMIYEEYRKNYFKCIEMKENINLVKNINYICMAICFFTILAFMYSCLINVWIIDFNTFLIFIFLLLMEEVSKSIFSDNLSDFPGAYELLDIKRKFPYIKKINSRFNQYINLHLLLKGLTLEVVSDTRKTVMHDSDLFNSPFRKEILEHLVLKSALKFDFQGAILEFRSNDAKKVLQCKLDIKNYNEYSAELCIDLLTKEYSVIDCENISLSFVNNSNERISIGFIRYQNKKYYPVILSRGYTPLTRQWKENEFVYIEKV